MRTFEAQLISPENRLTLADVISVDFATPEGKIQILGGHEAMVAELTEDKVTIKTTSGVQIFAVSHAFARVTRDLVEIAASCFEQQSDEQRE